MAASCQDIAAPTFDSCGAPFMGVRRDCMHKIPPSPSQFRTPLLCVLMSRSLHIPITGTPRLQSLRILLSADQPRLQRHPQLTAAAAAGALVPLCIQLFYRIICSRVRMSATSCHQGLKMTGTLTERGLHGSTSGVCGCLRRRSSYLTSPVALARVPEAASQLPHWWARVVRR